MAPNTDDDSVTRSVEIAAPPDRVWAALTDHRQFGAWFKVALDGPFALGQITRGAMTYPGHEGAPFLARAEVIEPPHRFVFAWPADDPEGQGAWTRVAFTLQPTPTGTRLTVTESGFAALPADRREARMRDNAEGWTIQTGNIRDHVERG